MQTTTENSPNPTHSVSRGRQIACMEVWGGHDAFRGCISVPGNDVFVSCDPWTGEREGGDIYYVSNCAAGLITRFVLADIAGHGAEVAAAARGLRDLMRKYINTPDQSRFVRSLNKAFGRETSAGRFATAVLVTYFAPTDHIIVCNAGHPRPLLFRADRNEWTLLDAATPGVVGAGRAPIGIANLPLGIIDPTRYTQFALRLGRSDLVVLYSDAFIEVADTAGRSLGEAGLLDVVRALDPTKPDEFRTRLSTVLVALTGTEHLADDATLIVLHHNASDPPRQGIGERAAMLARALGLRG